MHFSKKSGCRSSAGPEILAYVSHCSVKFQPILNCFISHSKLKYEDLGYTKTGRVNTFVLNLWQIKRRVFFWDTQYKPTQEIHDKQVPKHDFNK